LLGATFTASLSALAFAGVASAAAMPVAGGRYVGKTSVQVRLPSGRGPVTIGFTIADDRRSLLPEGPLAAEDSIIEEPFYGGGLPCKAGGWRIGGDGGNASNTPTGQALIDSQGRLRLRTSDPARGLDLVLSGRFEQHGQLVRGTIRVAGPNGCARRITFSARYSGQRHLVRGSCTPAGTTTVRDDGRIRIFHERYLSSQRGATKVTYACDRAKRRRYVVHWDDHDFDRPDFTDKTAIAGDSVAYSTFGCPSDFGCVARVGVLDAGTGRLRFIDDALGPDAPLQIPGIVSDSYRVNRVVVRPEGSAAWITCWSATRCAVLKEEGNGPTVVDPSGHVDRGSLQLNGSALSWTRAGMRQDGTLG
jgi:hypothetical protein